MPLAPGMPIGSERPSTRRSPRSSQRRARMRRGSAEEGVNVDLSQRIQAASLDETMASSTPAQSSNPARLYCPVPGCRAGDRLLHHGWTTTAGLKPHVDAHVLNLIPGKPPQAWMEAWGWVICGQCGKLVSRRCAMLGAMLGGTKDSDGPCKQQRH